MRLLLATTNPNKVREIRPLFAGADVELMTLADVPPVPEPPETGATFWENARQKALAYARATGLVAVAEDSGLVIDALGGEPGVRSARFLGDDVSYAARFEAIYARLSAVARRGRTPRGSSRRWPSPTATPSCSRPKRASRASWRRLRPATHGFGYDPIFLYPPLGKTTGEMTPEEKTAVSHRARAFRDLRRALFANRVAILRS